MSCKNLIGDRCALNREICPFLTVAPGCKMCDWSEIPKATFAQAIAIYNQSKATKETKRQIELQVRLVMSLCGFCDDDPVEKFDKRTAAKMCVDNASKYAPSSLAKFCGNIYGFASPKFSDAFEELNVEQPFWRPKDKFIVEVPRREIDELTFEQKQVIKWRIADLQRSTKSADRAEYIVWWFAINVGMRFGDICHQTWDIITEINGIPHVSYIPEKTKKYGIKVTEPIPTEAWLAIKDFVKPGESLLPIQKCRIRKGYEVKGSHLQMRKRLREFFRGELKVTSKHTIHLLRKDRAQFIFATRGAEAEAAALGHSVSIAQKSYYNKFKRVATI